MKQNSITIPQQQRQFIKVEDLFPDPNQPRKVFDQAKLKELADNLKEVGVIQDLIVEHRPALRVVEPDLVTKEWRAIEEGGKRVLLSGSEGDVRDFVRGKDKARYQIVDGERRWRAASLAGLKEVPVAVRVIDEKERLVLQVVANQQRENLTALEEAEAYRKEIDSGQHTAESLAKELGVSRGTVFARLALMRLHPPVRAALVAGKISVSVAGLVTMVPGLEAQGELLKELTDEDYPWSFRDVQEHIEAHYCRQLKTASFNPKTTYAGEFKESKQDAPPGQLTGTVNLFLRGACTTCCYRSGNMDAGATNPNVCTRPKCFEAKTQVAWLEQKLKAEAKGQRTISQDEWKKVKGQYVEPEEHGYLGNQWRSWKDAMGGQAKKLEKVLVQTPRGVVEVVTRKDAKEAARKNGVKIQSEHHSGPSWQEQEEKRKAKRAISAVAVQEALPLLEEKVKKLSALEGLQLVARRLEGMSEFRGLKGEKLKTEADARLALLRALYLDDDGIDWQGDLDDSFLRICKACKVDVEALHDKAKAEAKAKAAEKAPADKGKTKPAQ